MRTEVTWPSIPAMLRDGARQAPQTLAVVDGERRVDFAGLQARVDEVARGLIASGVAPGERVAIWAPKSSEWIVAALAITSSGAVLVPVNTRFRGAEAAFILERSGARALFTVRGFLDTDYPALLASAGTPLPALAHTILLAGEPDDDAIALDAFVARGASVAASELDVRVAAVGPDDPSDVVFTSGTTGSPKGVVMTHGQTLRAYLDWCDWADLRTGDRYLIANPFFHIFGYKAGCLACLMRRATIYPMAVFDAGEVLDIVERERITVLPGPPTMYHSVLEHPERAQHDIASLRLGVTGAADIPVELIRRVREELPFERILTGYGLTEAGTVTGCKPDDDFEHIATTVGVPWPGFEVRVVDDAGADVPTNEPGEVVVRGETVTRGYLDDDEATKAAIDSDGWLHTGDLGTIDADGYLRIVGRIKDMFIVGGFNAYPAEIENLMLRHPRIAQVAVIGVPDERLGEVAKAFVVLQPGSPVDADEIVVWAKAEMANFKAPCSVEFLDELPVNATGKVVKDELRAARTREQAMTQVPVADGIFTWPSADPQLIGSRCSDCGIVTFPSQESCPRSASMTMTEHLLARRGTLWAWTTQDFPPPAPPYSGASGKQFEPFGVGYVELPGEVKVETRLTTADPKVLTPGIDMELVIVPFRTDDDGNEVMTFAFRPAGEAS